MTARRDPNLGGRGGRKLTVPRGPSYLVQRARCEAVGDDRDGIHDAWPRWGADADANAGQAVAMVVEEKVEERKYAATDRCVHQVPHPRVTDFPVWIGKEGGRKRKPQLGDDRSVWHH